MWKHVIQLSGSHPIVTAGRLLQARECWWGVVPCLMNILVLYTTVASMRIVGGLIVYGKPTSHTRSLNRSPPPVALCIRMSPK